jgi:hypothetical protein
MFDDRSFRRVAAWAAIASAPLAVAGSVLALASVDFDLGAFADPAALLGAGARGAVLWRWAMVLDLFGRFLLVAPMFAVLARHWRVRGDAGRALGAAANAYVLAGAVGAVVLAATLPPIMATYASDPAQRATLAPLFDVLANAVYVGLWNMLGATLGGIAWLGFGAVLRADRPGLAGLSTTLGAAALVDALATMAGIHVAAMAGLSLYLVLAPVWALSAGVDALELDRRETASLAVLVPRAN